MTDTIDIKMVSDYTGLNFNEVIQLDAITYKILLKDAFISKMSKSEEGREFLEDAYNLRQVKPDRKALRARFKEE